MTAINTERLLNTFLELVRIDSPSGEESDVAVYCRKALEEAGCIIHVESLTPTAGSNTGNLIATLPAFLSDVAEHNPMPLYFSAHMDTVEPCRGVKPRIEKGAVYSDGTTILGGDDKVGLAAIIEMIQCLAEGAAKGEQHPEIRVLFSVKEEVGLEGAKAFSEKLFADAQGAFCYVLDAAGKPGLVVNGAPYQLSYKAEFIGQASHAGIAPEEGVSAIRAAALAVSALPQGRLDEQSTSNAGTIKGGSADNVVAAECLVTGELRSHSKDRLASWKATIEDALRGADSSVQVQINWELNYEGFFAAEDSPQVQLAMRAARKLGFETRTEIGNGGADTNILASFGLAAVSLGSGMERVHSTEEYLEIADLENLTRLALCIAKESLEVS